MKQSSLLFILVMIFVLCAMDFIQGNHIRKLTPDTDYWSKFQNYLTDKIWPEGETYENFIILYYGHDVEYKSGFENQYRKNISYIIYYDWRTEKNSKRSSEY